MNVAIPALLILMILMGVNVSNYSGMTVSDAYQDALYSHNYTIDDYEFNNVANKYINNPDYKNAYITNSDITTAVNVSNPYDYLVQSGATMWDEINGSFDSSWLPTVDSRSLKVYDNDGNLIGATEIVGVTNTTYLYRNQVTVQPELLDRSGYFQNGWLLFRTIDYRGTYYHTDLDFVVPSNGHTNGLAINNFQYKYWYNKTADNVSWSEGDAGGFWLELVYDNNTYHSTYQFVSPVLGRNDLEGDTEYIGEATLSDGTVVGVNPDGSVTLPNGTTVFPDSDTGVYPRPVDSVQFPADWWANIARLIGEGASSAPTSNTAAQTDILDSIRDSSAGLLSYMKDGFWTKFKSLFTPFEPDNVKTDIDDLGVTNYFDYLNTLWRKAQSLIGITPITRNEGVVDDAR